MADISSQLQSALQQWAVQNQAKQQQDYVNKVTAANPEYAKQIFGQQNAQAGINQGQQGLDQNAALLKLKQEEVARQLQQKAALGQIAQQYAGQQNDPLNGFLAQVAGQTGDPSDLAKYAVDVRKQQLGIGQTTPSAIQEYRYLQTLTPDQKVEWFRNKRADKSLDLGGQQVVLDPTTGQIAQTYDKTAAPKIVDLGGSSAVQGATGGVTNVVPKTLSPEAQPENVTNRTLAEKNAATQADAQANLPIVQNQANQALSTIDELLGPDGKGMAGIEGNLGVQGAIPNFPGSDASNAKVKMDQMQGVAFLAAYGQLKGAGGISEAEGKKAEDAIAALGKGQSKESYLKNLKILRGVIQNGVDVLAKKANGKSGTTGKVRVRKGNEAFEIDAKDLPDAQADGYEEY